MHNCELDRWQHGHAFDQHIKRPAEAAVRRVVAITLVMMAIEITAGFAFGSMALLADGIHMATHAMALAITAAAYALTRRLAGDPRFSFGSGKVNALAGFAGGLLLALFALGTVAESARRLVAPEPIVLDRALAVAVLGLAVNAGCALLLRGRPIHAHSSAAHAHDVHDDHHHHDHHADLNLRAAYLHVLADMLTSVLAIAALSAGKYLDALWLDPACGILGAVLVARWCRDLLGASAAVLLDRQAPAEVHQAVAAAIEAGGDARVADLHVWSIGPAIHAAAITVIAHAPRPPDAYRALLPDRARIVHATIEVQTCPGEVQTCPGEVEMSPGEAADAAR